MFIAGFDVEQRDKLCRILNFSGCTRYDDVSDRVSHVIVGDPTCHEMKLIASRELQNVLQIVSIRWLTDSISKMHPVPEEGYKISASTFFIEPSSPLSKKVSIIFLNCYLCSSTLVLNFVLHWLEILLRMHINTVCS